MSDQNKDKPTEDKPLVTFALFAYNQENYIREAVEGALAQNYTPLEIIISDDCSSDRTYEIIQDAVENYQGPHSVKLNKNSKNLGLIGHVNYMFEVASGDLIVAAAGDDISLPDRVKCIVDTYQQNGKNALLIHSSAMKINDLNADLGIFIPPMVERAMTSIEVADSTSLYIGATAAWSRALYEEFGPIVFQNAYEDLVLGFRAMIKESLFYIDKPLVRYRVGVGISMPASIPIPILKFSSRIASRRKKIEVFIDVYKQRLRDLSCVSGCYRNGELKTRLMKNVSVWKKNFYFTKIHLPCLLYFFQETP